jgi:hypothetical protein
MGEPEQLSFAQNTKGQGNVFIRARRSRSVRLFTDGPSDLRLVRLGFSNRFLWRCPTAELRRLHKRNVSARHLDVGVGTGYFLDKARWDVAEPEITLLDLNPNCANFALPTHRLGRPRPHCSAREPLPVASSFTFGSRAGPRMCVQIFFCPSELARSIGTGKTMVELLSPAMLCRAPK